MRRSQGSVAADERKAPAVSRRAGAAIVAALFLAAVFGVPHDARGAESRGFAAPVAGNSSPGRAPVVTRTTGTTTQLAAPRPVRQRQLDLDGLAPVAGAIALFGGFCRRRRACTVPVLHFDAVFALRRGPPLLCAVR